MPHHGVAARQYALGLMNRRMARSIASLDRIFSELTGEPGTATFLCACGREGGCDASVTIRLSEHARVLESPHRFVVAPGHAQWIDEVVARGDGFEIVEIKPQYRSQQPLTAHVDRTP